jgi:peptide/nickel transport system permease protein
MVMALSSTGMAVILGAIVGLVSGYMRGWVDELLMRIADILISMPPLIIAILVISAFGNHQLVIILIVALLFAPRVARVVRAATLAIVTEDYVTAAVCRGESALGIAVRELLPNVTGTVFVEFAIRSGFAIMFIGALGFLGFGAPPPTPEWGVMINEGRRTISASLWPVLSPALAMAGLVLAINLFTEGVARVIGRSPGSAGR